MKKITLAVLIVLGLVIVFSSAFPEQGEVLWKFRTNGEIYFSPALDDNGNIYFTSKDSTLYSLYPDGIERWRFKVVNENFFDPGTFGTFLPPVISEDNILYFFTQNFLYAFDSEGGIKWKYKRISSRSPDIKTPVLLEKTINIFDYTSSDANSSTSLIILDQQKGTLVKKVEGIKLLITIGAVPVGSQKEIYIYGISWNEEERKIDGSGILILDRNQESKWLIKLGNETGDPYSGWPQLAPPAIDYDGTLYFGTNKGKF